MVAGDTTRRHSTLQTPDPPLSFWGPDDKTQESLAQKALGFNCLHYEAPAEGALERHSLPNRSTIDSRCRDGLRLELLFPSCWDGLNVDSSDHRSHLAYPDLLREGACPKGFASRIPTLYFETIWNTSAFQSIDGRFLLSNGDPTGLSYHGDFLNGWDTTVLEEAISKCTSLSGLVEHCPIFRLQSAQAAAQCTLRPPSILQDEICTGLKSGLCGNITI